MGQRPVFGRMQRRVGCTPGRLPAEVEVPAKSCSRPKSCSRHLAVAATTPPLARAAAAAHTYARKFQQYSPVLKPHDVLLPVVCESWGGLHTGVTERLQAWARHLSGWADPSDLIDCRESLSPQILSIWRMRLSCAEGYHMFDLPHGLAC